MVKCMDLRHLDNCDCRQLGQRNCKTAGLVCYQSAVIGTYPKRSNAASGHQRLIAGLLTDRRCFSLPHGGQQGTWVLRLGKRWHEDALREYENLMEAVWCFGQCSTRKTCGPGIHVDITLKCTTTKVTDQEQNTPWWKYYSLMAVAWFSRMLCPATLENGSMAGGTTKAVDLASTLSTSV